MSKDDDLLSHFMDMHEDSSPERNVPQRAPFTYMGSKLRSIPNLMKHLPVRKSWIDHFCGSGVVTINRPICQNEVMNDRFGGITAFYRCLQNPEKRQALIDRVDATVRSREEFLHCRQTWVTETDDVERAAKWYYVIALSVMGKGVCYGRSIKSSRNPLLTGLELFNPVHHRLRSVNVENLDFEVCFKDYDFEEAVHYCDPPYIGTETSFYAGGGWNRDELERLLRCIANAKGFVALSGYHDDQIDKKSFWTKKVQWKVKQRAEPNVFNESNGKEGHEHRNPQGIDAIEWLWIKD